LTPPILSALGTALRWPVPVLYGYPGVLPGFNTFTGYDPERRNTVVVWRRSRRLRRPRPDGADDQDDHRELSGIGS